MGWWIGRCRCERSLAWMGWDGDGLKGKEGDGRMECLWFDGRLVGIWGGEVVFGADGGGEECS